MGSLPQDFKDAPAPKRIVICCDGTWQSSVSGMKNIPSNVTRLARCIARTGRDAQGKVWQQIVHYDAGIGTGELTDEDKERQGGFGIGFVGNVIEAYNFIVLNYSLGDEIFCFGFSRGAYTARAVAGLVNDIGIISPKDLQDFPDLYKLYQNNTDSHGFRKSKAYREWVNGVLADTAFSPISPIDFRSRSSPKYGKKFHADAPEQSRVVKVVGVFDTVGSLGVPDLSWTKLHLTWLNAWFGIPKVGFHNVALSPYIRHAYHALALDEHRAPFSPTLWHFPEDGDLSTKEPKRSHHEIHDEWRKARKDPKSDPQRVADLWSELIDSEMYDELHGKDSELCQVWLSGYHINIGGGDDDPLKERKGDFEQMALISLAWMCEQISPHLQLDVNLSALAETIVNDRYAIIDSPPQPLPSREGISEWITKIASGISHAISEIPNKTGLRHDEPVQISPEIRFGWGVGPMIDSFSGAMKAAGSTVRTPGQYFGNKHNTVKLGTTNEMIHPSVQYRMKCKPNYKPEALKNFVRQPVPGKGFEWTNGSTTIPEYLIKPDHFFSRYIAEAEKQLDPNSPALAFIHEIDKLAGATTA